MSLENEVAELVAQLKKMAGSGGPSINRGADFLGGVSGGANMVIDSFAKLSMGTYNVSAGVADMKTVLSNLGGTAGKAIGDVLGNVSDKFLVMNQSLNEAGKSGVNFDNNLGAFSEAVVGARMSIPGFTKMLDESGSKLMGLSGNAQKSAETFLAIGKDFAETDTVRQLNATGVGMEELNKVLIISASNRRMMDMNDDNGRKKVVQSAADMAVEMDNVARLTGVSRQQQEQQMQAQMKKAEVEIKLAAMSEDEAASYEANQLKVSRFGKEFQDVLTIYSTGGVRNAEDNAKVAGMGAKMAGLVEELSHIKGTTAQDESRRQAIMSELDRETIRITKDKNELDQRASNATSAGDFGKQQAAVTVGLLQYGRTLAQIDKEAETRRAKGEVNVTRETILTEQAAEAAEKRKKALESMEPGALINRAEMLIKDASAGAAKGFNGLNAELKQTIETTFPNLNKVLRPMTTEAFVAAFENFVKKVNPRPVDETEAIKNARVREDIERKEKLKPTQEKAGGGDYLANMPRIVGELGMEMDMPDIGGKVKTNDELRSLFGGQDTEIRKMMSNLKSEMKTHLAEAKSSIPSTDSIQKMFDNVKVSTATPQAPTATPSSDSLKDMTKGIDQLNMRMERLITAVELGADKNVRAVKTRGNMVA